MHQNWQLERRGEEVFVHHVATPRFVVKIELLADQSNPAVTFKPTWNDEVPPKAALDLLLRALDFYRHCRS